MKKLFNLFASAIVILCALTSCGSSKESAKISADDAYGDLVTTTDIQNWVSQSPKVRVYADGISSRLSSATAKAEYNARRAFVRQIGAIIIETIEDSEIEYNIYGSDGTTGSSKTDEEATVKQFAQGCAEGLVKGCYVAINEVRMTKDGRYRVFVGMEYSSGPEGIANYVAEEYKQQIPEEKRDKMDKTHNQLKNGMLKNIDAK